MLDGIKRWLSGSGDAAHDWEGIVPWAESHKYTFRGVAGQGFVIDGRLGATPWRLEWGPSQRPYISGQELRIRSELGLGPDLQLVVMNRVLHEAMEKAVYEQYVGDVQTRIDNQTPPEMRWLVIHPRIEGDAVAPIAQRYVALASQKTWAEQWLAGTLAQALQAVRADAATPVVLMIGRGRLMLRTALAEPELRPLQGWLRLFETAMREARRVANDSPDALSPSTQPSMWSQSALPGEERK